MDDLIGELWRRSPLVISREKFAKRLEGWTFDPVYENGDMVIVFLVNGPEFHFAKFTSHPAKKAHLAKYPATLIAQYGYATTRTPKDDPRQMRFNRKLGFVVTGEDEYDYHLRIERMRAPKEQKCQ